MSTCLLSTCRPVYYQPDNLSVDLSACRPVDLSSRISTLIVPVRTFYIAYGFISLRQEYVLQVDRSTVLANTTNDYMSFAYTCRTLSTCRLSTSQPVNQSTSQPVNQSTCQPVNLSTCLPVNLSTCQPVYMSTCLPVYLSTCLPVYLSTCLPVYLSTCLPVYLST